MFPMCILNFILHWLLILSLLLFFTIFQYLLFMWCYQYFHSVPPNRNLKLPLIPPHDPYTGLLLSYKHLSNLFTVTSHTRNIINAVSLQWLFSFTMSTSLQLLKLLTSKLFLHRIYHNHNFSCFCDLFEKYFFTRLTSPGEQEPSLSFSPIGSQILVISSCIFNEIIKQNRDKWTQLPEKIKET